MNNVCLCGYVDKEPVFSHECMGENFYEFYMTANRDSGVKDFIKCIVPEVFSQNIEIGNNYIFGEIRTRNVREENNRLETTVFVNGFYEPDGEDCNIVELEGFICKEPIYRETPLGRQICDLALAVNRKNSRRSDYIYCIAWGRTAVMASKYKVGTEVKLSGRLQSREYSKCLEDGTVIERTIHEVSIKEICKKAVE